MAERLKILDEMIASAEHKLDNSFFVQQVDAIKKDICRLNKARKEVQREIDF